MARISRPNVKQAQRFARNPLTPEREWQLEMRADGERAEAQEQEQSEREASDSPDA